MTLQRSDESSTTTQTILRQEWTWRILSKYSSGDSAVYMVVHCLTGKKKVWVRQRLWATRHSAPQYMDSRTHRWQRLSQVRNALSLGTDLLLQRSLSIVSQYMIWNRRFERMLCGIKSLFSATTQLMLISTSAGFRTTTSSQSQMIVGR